MANVFAHGYDPKDSAKAPNDTDMERFVAGEVIEPGMLVVLSTADANGRTVVKATAALHQAGLSVGVFTGIGGTGTAAATTGLSGYSAKTGDVIQVVKQGFAAVQGSPQTTGNMITAGTVVLGAHGTTAGLVQEKTATFANGANLWSGIATTAGTVYVVTARVNFR